MNIFVHISREWISTDTPQKQGKNISNALAIEDWINAELRPIY